MDFYDILAAEKWGGGIPTINFFDLLFAQSISGGEQWQVYEGTLPATFNANGDDMRQYQVYGAAGGVGDRTANVMPAGEKKTVVNNGITFESDGSGCYHISGTASAYSSAIFNLTSGFTTPVSVSSGGQGTLSFFNSLSTNNVKIVFCNGTTKIDDWVMTPINRTNAAYNAIENKYVDNIAIIVLSGTTVDMTIMPEFTNDGVLPSEFESYSYKLDISTSDGTNATTTPIYIGDTALQKDEYADYKEQKVYRRTENEFDVNKVNKNMFLGLDNVTGTSEVTDTSDYICIKNFSYGLLKSLKTGNPLNTNVRVFCFYDSQKKFLGRNSSLSYEPSNITDGVTISIPNNVEYVRFSYDKRYSDEVMFILSDFAITPPETYIPYLQLTDPPVPLPALPTCEGTTIVDYAGQSVAPEKVVFEYAKGGS